MTAVPTKGAATGSAARAIACSVSAILLFSTMNAAVKTLGEMGYPLSQIVFCRAFFALVAISPMIVRNGGLASLRTARPLGHAGRSLIGLTSMCLGFTAITLLPLANAVALGFTAPLFTTILGIPLLGERIRWRRAAAVLVGFAGVLVMVRPNFGPGGEFLSLGTGLALAGAFCAALAMISIRRLSSTEPSTTIVFYFMAAASLVSGAVLPFQFVMPDLTGALLLVAIGLIGGVAQVLLTTAYRNAPVAVVAPFDYTAMLWATGWGFVLWGHVPDRAVMVGAAIVVASGIYILYREVKLGVAQDAPPKVRPNLS
ncbi:MAG TPA: DMT family transporter [Azospirillaceae bacterium]|nr:DMT family transporter [Azospirillaceae bacterium]